MNDKTKTSDFSTELKNKWCYQYENEKLRQEMIKEKDNLLGEALVAL